MTQGNLTYDIVIAGGGLCGCVLASKIHKAHPNLSIVIVEAGKNDLGNPEIYNTALDSLNSPYVYKNMSVRQPECNNREVLTLTGNTLGGGSTVNYGGWFRGHAADYDFWAKIVGDQRWSYKELLPYFRRVENYQEKGNNEDQHGFEGPIISYKASRSYPLKHQFRKALEEAGYKYNPDMNSGNPNGFANVVENFKYGKRQPSGAVYELQGIDIMDQSIVEKVILEDVNGKLTAIGIQLDNSQKIFAKKEVIVSCGSLKTPQLLMLSGIGPQEELKKFNIPQVVDLPVGKNFHDHPSMCLEFKVKEFKDGQLLGSPGFANNPRNFEGIPTDWFLSCETPEGELIKAAQIDGDQANLGPRTNLEVILLYLAGSSNFGPNKLSENDGQTFTTLLVGMDPTSRGIITLKSTNPNDYPVIDPNYFATEHDKAVMRAGIKQVLGIFLDTKAGQEFVLEEVNPQGYPKLSTKSSDTELDQRRIFMGASCFHPAGTASMGSVVDSKCRVMGVKNLRVIDASIFTIPITAHLQYALYAIAESMSDLISQEL